MAKYRNSDDPRFHLDNVRLIPWIEKNLSPGEWLIELTGGEPTLYTGFEELLGWLSGNGYTVHVRTNGMIPIRKFPGVTRIAAFHDFDNPPTVFDCILIIDKLDSERKIRYCEEHGLKYRVIGLDDDNPDRAGHGFRLCGFMDPQGHPAACKARHVLYTEWPDRFALEFQKLKTTLCCENCKPAIDAWRFMGI